MPAAVTHMLRLVLPHDPSSVRSARSETARALQGRWPSGLVADLLMVVSELVDNAITHTRGGCTLTLQHLDTKLIVEVHDGDVQSPRRRDDGPDELGRGLGVVQTLAHRWGVERTARGKCVWAEFIVPAVAPERSMSGSGPSVWNEEGGGTLST